MRQVDMHRPPWHNSAWPTATDRRLDRRWPPAGRPGHQRTDRRPCKRSVPAAAGSPVRRTSRTGPATRWRRWWASPITCRPVLRRAPAAAPPAPPVPPPRRPVVPGPHPEDLNTRQTPPVCIFTRQFYPSIHLSIHPPIYPLQIDVCNESPMAHAFFALLRMYRFLVMSALTNSNHCSYWTAAANAPKNV